MPEGRFEMSVRRLLAVGTIAVAAGVGGAAHVADAATPSSADIAVSASASPATPSLSQSTAASFVVSNRGPGDATNLVVAGSFPAGVRTRSVVGGAGSSCGSTGNPVTGFRCTYPTLPSGATVTVSAYFDADALGALSATATASSDGSDPDTTNNTATATALVHSASADASLSLDVAPGVVTGGSLTYGLQLSDQGPDPVKSLTGSLELPAGVSAPTVWGGFDRGLGVSGCVVPGATWCMETVDAFPTMSCWFPGQDGARSVTCRLSDDAPFGPEVGSERATFSATAPSAPGSLTSTAKIDAQPGVDDPRADNDTASVTTLVTSPGDVDLALTSSAPTAVLVGTDFDVSLRARNGTATAATGVSLTETLPPGVTFASASGVDACTGTTIVTCSVPTIVPFATQNVTLHLHAAAAGNGTLAAAVSENEHELTPGDNAAASAVTVRSPTSDIVVDAHGPATVTAGNIFTVAFEVTNRGPETASSVIVHGVLPAGVHVVSSLSSACVVASGDGFDCFVSPPLFANQAVFLGVALTTATAGPVSIPFSVTQPNADPDHANDTPIVNVDVLPRPTADVAVAVSAPRHAQVGDTVTYTVAAVNHGPDTANGVTITAAVYAAAFADLTAAPAPCAVSATNGSLDGQPAAIVRCSGLTLPAGETFTATLTMRALSAGSFPLYGLATESSLELDPDGTNGQTRQTLDVSNPVEIVCGADVAVPNDPGAATAAVSLPPATASGGSGVAAVAGARDDGAALDAPYPIGRTTVTWTALDPAGDTATCMQRVTVDDVEPPAASLAGDAPAGWQSAPVTLRIRATDNSGDVASIHYRATGAGAVDEHSVTGASTDVTISDDGETTVSYWAVDKAGNASVPADAVVRVDSTAPTTALTPSGPAGAAGWYAGDATVAASAADATSGVAAIELSRDGGASFTPYTGAATLGDGVHDLVVRAVDAAGNSATSSLTIRVDGTPPTVALSPSGPAGANGWYIGDVSLSATADDATSGVAGLAVSEDGGAYAPYTGPLALGEGVHVVTARATDAAGNTAAGSATIRIDETPPEIAAARDLLANAAGWVNTDVTVAFTCSDGGSGVATCPAPAAVTTEGANQSVAGTAVDAAGNTAQAVVGSISIDKTAPTIGFAGNRGVYGVADSIDIACTATDALSGLAAQQCPSAEGAAASFAVGPNTLNASATDAAGNTAESSATFTVVVVVDAAGLCTLVQRDVSSAGIAQSLCAKLQAASATAQGAKPGAIRAFTNELRALTGKSISATDAALLERLAAEW
jgi:uncharacterized repeat protein (TIGR01451 family)